MRQAVEVNCNCYRLRPPPNDQYFLTQQAPHSQITLTHSSHRNVKSNQLPQQPDNKNHKKSLKKRANSSHQPPTFNPPSTPLSLQMPKMELERRIEHVDEGEARKVGGWQKAQQNPLGLTSNPFGNTVISFPECASYVGRNEQRQPINSYMTHPPYRPTQLRTSTSLHPQPPSPQLTISNPQPAHRQLHTPHSPTTKPPSDYSHIKNKHQASRESFFQDLTPQGFHSNTLRRGDRMVTESWAHNQEDLVIQGFDKLFKNREDNMSHSNLPSSQRVRPRELQKSKRIQQQKLIGRFAQSDNDSNSDSQPSEVIGRGFDRTYQDLLLDNQGEGGGGASETKASRSTNTKVSQMNNRRWSAYAEDNFGRAHNFKTHKFL